jgi:hypothetical protein
MIKNGLISNFSAVSRAGNYIQRKTAVSRIISNGEQLYTRPTRIAKDYTIKIIELFVKIWFSSEEVDVMFNVLLTKHWSLRLYGLRQVLV